MRKILTLVVAVTILTAAYAVTFGLPTPVAAMIGVSPESTSKAAPSAGGGGQGAGAARGPGGGAGRATTVVTTALTLQPYESTLNAIGTATALRSIDVASNASGTVTEADFTANRTVAAGDVLLRLDARTQALNLEIAQANLKQASDTVTRYERIRTSANATVTEVTLSEARVQQSLAEAAVGLAQVALDDRTIRAPIAGQLGLSNVEVGSLLTANTVISTIDQSNILVVEFELPERAIGLLKKAKTVSVGTASFRGRVFEGDIVSFDSRIDSVTRSVTVKAQVANPDNLLWPGMTFAVRLTQESEPMAALPSTAIAWSRSGSNVWVDADGVAKAVPVTILFRRDDTVWVDAKIDVGTMVVTEGAQKLREGARITTPGAKRPDGAQKPDGAAKAPGQPAKQDASK
ncbi:efflux RND transporter periplasmic adaptor subunit [Pseudorhodobacter sp. W20_MBD10_FR17]|uniref:efflux RND transporter periplasmic adaptor subunit n=1 Tax=Pseudorhodobacter sp. W20_MBD10_FR17 TaxID=3240266 RepID=UPI003F94EC29